MEYKFSFKTKEEREKIIKENEKLTLIKTAFHLNEYYLIFTDEEIIYELTENEILKNKMSNLEKENEALKTELTITQDAINELILLSMSL